MAAVLVVYASKHGSTAEIADTITARLAERGHDATCVDAGEAPKTLEGYDGIVLGSAVYMRRWRREARRFLRKHGRELSGMPFWVFSSGPAGEPNEDDDGAWSEPAHTIRKAESLGVREHVVFDGRIPLDPGGPIERAMLENTPEEYVDRRDWEQIGAWADEIAAALDGDGA